MPCLAVTGAHRPRFRASGPGAALVGLRASGVGRGSGGGGAGRLDAALAEDVLDVLQVIVVGGLGGLA